MRVHRFGLISIAAIAAAALLAPVGGVSATAGPVSSAETSTASTEPTTRAARLGAPRLTIKRLGSKKLRAVAKIRGAKRVEFTWQQKGTSSQAGQRLIKVRNGKAVITLPKTTKAIRVRSKNGNTVSMWTGANIPGVGRTPGKDAWGDDWDSGDNTFEETPTITYPPPPPIAPSMEWVLDSGAPLTKAEANIVRQLLGEEMAAIRARGRFCGEWEDVRPAHNYPSRPTRFLASGEVAERGDVMNQPREDGRTDLWGLNESPWSAISGVGGVQSLSGFDGGVEGLFVWSSACHMIMLHDHLAISVARVPAPNSRYAGKLWISVSHDADSQWTP